jgi:hypothetical protein
MKFLETNKDGCRFRVIARSFEHGDEVTRLRKDLEATDDFVEPYSCGVNSKGERHPDNERCPNWFEDDEACGCRVKGYMMGKRDMVQWMWMPAILDHYWSTDLGQDGLDYLESRGFVYTYR